MPPYAPARDRPQDDDIATEFAAKQAVSAIASFRADRDRFVAFAFTWADILLELEASGKVVYAAGAVESFLGRPGADLVGTEFADLAVPDQRATAQALLAAVRRGARIEAAAIDLRGAGAEPLGACFTGYRLPELSGHIFMGLRCRRPSPPPSARDEETGLLEQRAFIEQVCSHLADPWANRDQSISLLRLAGWDEIRQRPGGPGAGEILRAVADCLQAHSSGGDLAARIGPDRVGLLHASDLDLGKLEQELLAIARDIDPRVRRIGLEWASFDMACAGLRSDEITSGMVYLLTRFRSADGSARAMSSLSRTFSKVAKDAVEAIEALRRTVARGDYSVVYQPILHAHTGDIHHYEALARFPANGLLRNASEHVLLAEEIGLVSDLDIGMARKVVARLQASDLIAADRVAVNLSGQSATTPGYLEQLDGLLADNGWLRGRLMFEITESSRMRDLPQANRFVLGLRAEGYDVCLDDFGAGAANFQYLASLDVSIVKFDGGAVHAARESAKGMAFLKSLVTLCRELEIATVVEMVDTPESLAFARACGADYVQGYLFGKPHADMASFARVAATDIFRNAEPV